MLSETGNMTVYRLRVHLLDIDPPIWREIELASDATLAQLHRILQTAMGWDNCHLHEFEVGERRYGVPDPDFVHEGVLRETTVKLSKVLEKPGTALLYVYDFGDNWTHTVTLEDIFPAEPGVTYPRVIAGSRACPPEDCGGARSYAEFLDILSKPRHKEHRRMREWVGPEFDPERISLETINRLLQRKRDRGVHIS